MPKIRPGDMFQNLKDTGSIQKSRPDHYIEPETKPSLSRRCSQCKEHRATGSAQMANGKWVRVCRGCKKAMAIPRSGQKPNSQVSKPPRHGSDDTKPQTRGGRHRL